MSGKFCKRGGPWCRVAGGRRPVRARIPYERNLTPWPANTLTAPGLLQALADEDRDLLKEIVYATVQRVLEAEMEQFLGAAPYERTASRRGYRASYYSRKLITRVGTIELRVLQDREGKFSTELFERYQRSEKALVLAILEMCIQEGQRGG